MCSSTPLIIDTLYILQSYLCADPCLHYRNFSKKNQRLIGGPKWPCVCLWVVFGFSHNYRGTEDTGWMENTLCSFSALWTCLCHWMCNATTLTMVSRTRNFTGKGWKGKLRFFNKHTPGWRFLVSALLCFSQFFFFWKCCASYFTHCIGFGGIEYLYKLIPWEWLVVC